MSVAVFVAAAAAGTWWADGGGRCVTHGRLGWRTREHSMVGGFVAFRAWCLEAFCGVSWRFVVVVSVVVLVVSVVHVARDLMGGTLRS